MAVILAACFGKPANVTVIDVPASARAATIIWQNDFDTDMVSRSIVNDMQAGTGVNNVSSFMAIGQIEVNVARYFTYDAPLVTHIDPDPESNFAVTHTDIDHARCLEIGGEFEGVMIPSIFWDDPPWSIPRYSQSGTTLDCDTALPLATSQVFVHNPVDGQIKASSSSDGAGAFNVPMFEPGPHFIRAVNGAKTAVSLPVLATVL